MARNEDAPAGQAGARCESFGGTSHRLNSRTKSRAQDRSMIARARAAMADAFGKRP